MKFGLPKAMACGLLLAAGSLSQAYADQFDISWNGPFGNGSAIADATNVGGGDFLVTSLDNATQDGLPITLLPVNTYGENDNLVLPGDSPQLDNNGIGFSDGVNDYALYWAFSTASYSECSSAVNNCIGVAGEGLTSFSMTSAAAPEPATIWYLAAASLGLLGMCFLRRKASGLPSLANPINSASRD